MHLVHLEIDDFRNLSQVRLELEPVGTTAIVGPNGSGKTSLIEAVAYLGTQRSFRGSPRDALIARDAPAAVIRAITENGGRRVSIDAELRREGPSRTLVNRKSARRRVDLHDALRASVFSPEDTETVRGGPAARRQFLDDLLALSDLRGGALVYEVERIVRQRGALLRQAGPRPSPDILLTLDVWDDRLAVAGTALAQAREELVQGIVPLAARSYAVVAGRDDHLDLTYRRSWTGDLAAALAGGRADDLRRATSLVGPHRDELEITLDGQPARTHASQGEQRTAALALTLAAHRLATERLASPPVLLLDDVFSELDPDRSAALTAALPAAQTLLTTASPLPPGVAPVRTLDIRALRGEPG